MKKNIIVAVAKENKQRSDVVDALRCAQSVSASLSRHGYDADVIAIGKKELRNPSKFISAIKRFREVCVFNLFEGFSDDVFAEAVFVRLLERAGIDFTGNGSRTLRLCLDKPRARKVLRDNKVPVAPGLWVKSPKDIPRINLQVPLFVKPAFENASVGIDSQSLVRERRNLNAVIKKKLANFPRGVLVEEFIGGKEYAVALAGAHPYSILGISVLEYKQYKRYRNIQPFLTYSSKWDRDSKEYYMVIPHIQKSLSDNMSRRIMTIVRRAGLACGCRGYFRVDIRERCGQLFVLEVNANPCINADSGFMRLARRTGFSYYDVLALILSSVKCSPTAAEEEI